MTPFFIRSADKKKTNEQNNFKAANLSNNTSKSDDVAGWILHRDQDPASSESNRSHFYWTVGRNLMEPEPKLLAAECCACPCRKQVRNHFRREGFRDRSPLLSPEHCMARMHANSSTEPFTLNICTRERARERERESPTHVSDACMNTLRTGVPGAGLFSGQSDIYRHEMEKRGGVCVPGGGGVMIPAVLTN